MKHTKPLYIGLTTEFYDAFADGSKTIEYRKESDPRYTRAKCPIGRPVRIEVRQHVTRWRPTLYGTVVGYRVTSKLTKAFKRVYPGYRGRMVCVEIKKSGGNVINLTP